MKIYTKESSSLNVQGQMFYFGLPLVPNDKLSHHNSTTKSGFEVYWKQHSPLKVQCHVVRATQ